MLISIIALLAALLLPALSRTGEHVRRALCMNNMRQWGIGINLHAVDNGGYLMTPMPRIARAVVPNVPHHVTQRGNRGCDVFSSDVDRCRHIELLRTYAQKHGLAIDAYGFMTDHVHLIVTPGDTGALAATLKPVHLRYAQHVNWTQGIAGPLWQGRFFSCPLDEAHFVAAARYVEQNPVRAGLVARATDYPWSSAAAHCGERADPLLDNSTQDLGGPEAWSHQLAVYVSDDAASRLRLCTRTGRPAGGSAFVAGLERLLGRVLHPRVGGRPRKT